VNSTAVSSRLITRSRATKFSDASQEKGVHAKIFLEIIFTLRYETHSQRKVVSPKRAHNHAGGTCSTTAPKDGAVAKQARLLWTAMWTHDASR